MSDAALVCRAQAGDELAFRRLLDKYWLDLCLIVRGYYLQGGDREDLMQEALFGFHKAVRDFRPDRGSGFRRFANLCARRQVITMVKTATRAKHRPLNEALSFSQPQLGASDDEDLSLESILPDASSDPAGVIERREDLGSVIGAVDRLSGLERAAVVGIAEGRTYREICERTGNDHKQIDNAAQRGKRRIARALEAAA